jgi:periplasmic protein TonB
MNTKPLLLVCCALVLTSCASNRNTTPNTPTPVQTQPPRPQSTSPATPSGPPMSSSSTVYSNARTPEQYRIELAQHVLAKSARRVLATPLPNPVHGVAVVEMTISRDGKLQGITPMRLPPNVPEAKQWIADLMQAASPLPQPQFATAGKSSLVIIETWFFMDDGRFHMRAVQPAQSD